MKTISKAFKIAFSFIMLVLILSAVAWGLFMEPEVKFLSSERFDEKLLTNFNKNIEIYDSSGAPAGLIADRNFKYAKIAEVPQSIIDAFLSIEDRRYYSHHGVDYIRVLSAVKSDVLSMSYKEGASTISQQLIKNTHLTNEKKLSRKLTEMRLAIDMERQLNKDEILESYLNILYFGNEIYGIANASEIIFGKDIKDVDLAEAAALAGMINNPKIYSPYLNFENALKRRNTVLKQMNKYGKISKEEYDKAINDELAPLPLNSGYSQYFNNVIKEAAEILYCSEADLYGKKLKIETYSDKSIDQAVEKAVSGIYLPKDAIIEVIVCENTSGKVLSVYSNTRKNLAYTLRQPGSTIKPLVSYAPAIENNGVLPITPILDEKMSFNGYSPSNYKNIYEGWTSVQSGLVHSSNVCAVKLLEINGIEKAQKYAEKSGIVLNKKDSSLSVALGGLTDGVTLRQIADTYSMFANGGKYLKSGCIKTIKDYSGKVLYERRTEGNNVFSEETSYLINNMLSDCARSGTAKLLAAVPGVCAKTGTVGDKDGNSDAYCIAYNKDYTIAVWIGSLSNKKTAVTGGGYPALIARRLFESGNFDSSGSFMQPENIIEAEIDLNVLKEKHKIVAAPANLPARFKQKIFCTKATAPKQQYNDYYSFLDDKSFYNLDFNEFYIA